jgi:hypothetical protein
MPAVCFTITGEFITEHTRQLWLEKPDRAVEVLLADLPGITPEQVINVLTGHSKLTGDSNTGIEIEDDNDPPPLPSLASVLKKYRCHASDAERDLADVLDLANNEGVLMASPRGAVLVSRRTAIELTGSSRPSAARLFATPPPPGSIQWEEVWANRIYQMVDVGSFCDAKAKPDPDPEPKPDQSLPEPPEPQSKITSSIGWLAPDGKFTPCKIEEHRRVALLIVHASGGARGHRPQRFWDPEGTLEKRGFIKLAGDHGAFAGIDRKPTKRQNRSLLEWCTGEGSGLTPLPYWLKA